MGNQIHIVHQNGQWKVKQDGARRSSGNFSTQREASERGRDLAIKQGKELTIHRKDNGQIREKNSFGNDPYPPKG